MGSFYNNKKMGLFTMAPPTGGLTWYQRSNSTTFGNACDATPLNNCRLDTTGNVNEYIPEVGNVVYNHLSGTTLFNGNNLFYVFIGYISDFNDPIYYCQVNTVGVILSVVEIDDCPGEL